MKQSLKVVSVKVIVDSTKPGVRPGVVLCLSNGKDLFRAPKQMLMDLHNNALGSGIRKGAFDAGMSYVDMRTINKLKKECIALRGGVVTGDFEEHKAGETYKATQYSRCIVDKQHPLYGKVNIGDAIAYEKDNFELKSVSLELELSEAAMQRQANADAYAELQADLADMSMFSIPTGGAEATPEDDATPQDKAMETATGKVK